MSRAAVHQGIYLIEGDETPEEVIALAYGLEEGARRFYRALAEAAGDGAAGKVFADLAAAETGHENALWERYSALGGRKKTREQFESEIVADVLEGGATPERALAHYGPVAEPREALELAMALETDALDLYLRLAQKAREEASRTLFEDLAAKEREHLVRLGAELRRTLTGPSGGRPERMDP